MQLGSQAMIVRRGRPIMETLDVVPGIRHGLVEQTVGDQRPAATAQAGRSERDRAPSPI